MRAIKCRPLDLVFYDLDASAEPRRIISFKVIGFERRAALRPMEPGQVIDLALRIFQRNTWTALRLTAHPIALCQAGVTFVSVVVAPELFSSKSPGNIGTEVGELVFAITIAVLVALPLFCFGFGRSVSLVASLTSAAIHGAVDE